MRCKKERFDTVVLSGGGIKGIGTLGAVHYLSKQGYLKHARTFIGSSAGAIVAACLAMNLNSRQVFDEHILPFRWKHDIDLSLLDRGYGVDTGAALDAWMASLFPKDLTFEQLRKQYGSTLIVTVTNLNTRHAEYFCPATTPDVSILKALRMSCSVPLYFAAVEHDEKLYVDGGISDNFPVEHAYEVGSKKVLGIRFVPKPKPPKYKWTLDAFLGAVLESSLIRRVPQNATIISLECGSTTMPLNFKISEDIKHRLFEEGYAQTALFMKKHR
jgi:predicted acylesterase/phospholipase RssA